MNRKKTYIIICMMAATVLFLITTDHIVTAIRENSREASLSAADINEADKIIDAFAKENGLTAEDYPEKIRKLLAKNPETEEFVLNYPLKKDLNEKYSLEEYINCDYIPHLMQWDLRWGYKKYAGDIMAFSGCGPVCLSMVAIYLTGDISFTPDYIADFAEKEGYTSENNGTSWLLMSEGAEKLGLISRELPLHKESIISALRNHKPVILIMKPGDFTTEGHFIVLTEYDKEGFTVLDPNSEERSNKKWTYKRLENQINNIWCFSAE